MVRVCSIRDIECTRGCTNVCQREFDELKDKAYAAGVAAGKERERCNALSSKLNSFVEVVQAAPLAEGYKIRASEIVAMVEENKALTSRLDAALDLLRESAPVTWCLHHDTDGAHQWEIKAEKLLDGVVERGALIDEMDKRVSEGIKELGGKTRDELERVWLDSYKSE